MPQNAIGFLWQACRAFDAAALRFYHTNNVEVASVGRKEKNLMLCLHLRGRVQNHLILLKKSKENYGQWRAVKTSLRLSLVRDFSSLSSR